ncbi:lipase family protein [Acaryochloris marina]|uniref:Lipase n=1 Tax=Acaryochloris marina (strain MBIC 11017) TaxID=329726 RepID=A8ZLS6_ACAM1|nr:lipase family protein [Acaryochloris marina]ABW32103.1 lipase precursor [Acaryochloris marina MBIC11017]BDM83096.1 hypothetical protein AM10699_59570 [Acaryochloris marina MBIC10699]
MEIVQPPSGSIQNLNRLIPPNHEYNYFEEGDTHHFKYDSNEYQLVNAWRLADSAFLAYIENEPVCEQHFKKIGLNKAKLFSGSSTQCYVASNDKFSIISFRGTEIKRSNFVQDVLIDARLKLVDSSIIGKTHEGFKAALDEIWEKGPNLKGYLQELIDTNQEMYLWFTGHSLGGALAILAASRFGKAQGIYTYGCPKVGNSEFVDSIDKKLEGKIFRFVNNNDAITKFPLSDLIISVELVETPFPNIPFPRFNSPLSSFQLPELYQHVGELKHIDKNTNISTYPSKKVDYNDILINSSQNIFESTASIISKNFNDIKFSLIDHAPEYYSVHLRNNFARDLGSSTN